MALLEASPIAFSPVAPSPVHCDEYRMVPATVLKAERLYAQHDVYGSSFDYLLHPNIQIPTQNPRIAAVGVGAAPILSELASRLPGKPELHGFETGIGYPGRLSNLASNVKLHDVNVMLGFPVEFQGTFDVVTVRLLVTTLTGDDWRLVAENLMKLLKPGGWLQWQEPDGVRSVTILADEFGAQKNSLQAFLNEAFADKAVYDKLDYPSRHLEGVLIEAGLHGIFQDIVSSDKQPYLRYNAAIIALQDLSGIIGNGVNGKKLAQEKLDISLRDCMEDLESGAYHRYNLHCFIGMKL